MRKFKELTDKEKKEQISSLFKNIENMNIDFIQIFDNAIEKDVCKRFVNKFKAIDKNGDTYDGNLGSERIVNKDRKLSRDVSLSKYYDDELDSLYKIMLKAVMSCVYSYLVNVGFFGISFVGMRGMDLKRYVPDEHIPRFPKDIALASAKLRKYEKNKGGYFVPHYDNEGDLSRRIVAVVIYLNDIKYGGETSFPVLKRNIKPRIGRIAIFPSYFTHIHYGKTSPQDKYVIVGHIESFRDVDEINSLKKQLEKEKEKNNG